jgi:hypothetical protein
MPEPIMRVDGARELRATMKAAGANLSDLNAVNKQTASLVSAEAVGRTPRRTGALAATVRPAGTRTAAIVRAGRASVPYANVIEFGWPARGIEAQPWVYEAAQAKESQWTSYYEAEIDKIVGRIRGAEGG